MTTRAVPRGWLTLLTLLGALFACGLAAAAPAAAPGPPALTRQDAETWLDGLMPYALARGGVPGAEVVIVKDGQVLLEKGYGLSDIARHKGFDPKVTLFRVGSVSKLFTWTAVMQLVEQHRLDLDADVNRYLDFTIPPRHGRPITLRNLMTHTAGFEEATRGIATDTPRELVPLDQALKRWVPARVFDPGTTTAYSNYGAALAGYIVQRVSGEPFADYVARHVFSPLGMAHSTFRQPLPATWAGDMAQGYVSSATPPSPYELVIWQPAGSVTTDGDDMARFMIAHLQDGRYGGASILQPATARAMHTTALTMIPPLNRMDLGFYEKDVNGRRVIGHDGDTVLFHATVNLYLDQGVGLFAVFNGAGKDDSAGAIRASLFGGFSDRYFPATAAAAPTVDRQTARAHAQMLRGAYAQSRRSFDSFVAAAYFLYQAKVSWHEDDGTISVTGFNTLSGDPRRYRETTPYVWREVGGGHDRLAAEVQGGRVVRFSTDEVSTSLVLQPIPAWQAAAVLGPVSIAAFAAVVATVLLWPVSALVRWRYRAPFPLQGRRAAGYRLVRVGAAVAVLALLGWGWVFSVLQSPTGIFVLYRYDAQIHLIQALTLLGLVGGLGAAVHNAWAVVSSRGGWFAIVWSGVLVLAFAALTWLGLVVHLLGFGTQY